MTSETTVRFGQTDRGSNFAIAVEDMANFPFKEGQRVSIKYSRDLRCLTLVRDPLGSRVTKQKRSNGEPFLRWTGPFINAIPAHRRVPRSAEISTDDGETAVSFHLPPNEDLHPPKSRGSKAVARNTSDLRLLRLMKDINMLVLERDDVELMVDESGELKARTKVWKTLGE